MNVYEKDNLVVIENVLSFNLEHIFECGQCFRWNKNADKSYTGVAAKKAIRLWEEDGTLFIEGTTKEEFFSLWYDYFDFETDYEKIKEELKKDKTVKEAIKSGFGIRILRQELFETVISFIISQNNNIPRIKLIIERFCELFGDKIYLGDKEYFAFPDYTALKDITTDDLKPLKAGFRDKYIIDAIKKFNDGFSLSDDYTKAKEELLKIKGIGEKVANCILLFSLHHTNAFPIDVWVKRLMNHYYSLSPEEISEFAKENFGELSGFAQQYLFYHARGIKLK